ncbi:citrate lyase beta subunit [Acinetobacter calcoaceticus]|uniref:Citrate lyase beta subunit n=1 Tax=Acinetobacter calcoaceticus TaxID=471 RepID=A0A4R1XQE9_ACICA|nr:citrate lyase beta subunit [Acinetobacter calcoaceticus]
MAKLSSALELGASMYVPAIHNELWAISQGVKYPQLKSLIVCLEDSIHEHDIPTAMINLKNLLKRRLEEPKLHTPTLFIRPRNVEMAKHIVDWQLNTLYDGMILPKFHVKNLKEWQENLPSNLHLMPTLETEEIFDMGHITELKHALKYDFHKVLCLRIGGNDLLSCLQLRRPKHVTIYQTPLGALITQLVGHFVPMGFQLSSPVCENIANTALLQEELKHDLLHGLLTKTAIHPCQIDIIHHAYKVELMDYQDATQILSNDAKAVFKSNGAMLEPTTHRNWAESIVRRAEIYGFIPQLEDDILHLPQRGNHFSA